MATSSFNTGLSTNLNLSTRISVSARVLARPQFQPVPQHVSQPLTAPRHTSASQTPTESITKPFETDPARIERRFLYVDNGGAPGRRRSVVSQRAPAAAEAGTAFFLASWRDLSDKNALGMGGPVQGNGQMVRVEYIGLLSAVARCRLKGRGRRRGSGGGEGAMAACVPSSRPPAELSPLKQDTLRTPADRLRESGVGADIPRQMY